MTRTANPKVSIITINLNNKIGLRKTIESVITQTSNDFEYIIIDGASTDGSLEVLKEFGDKIDYWISEKDSGIYYAMNKGIKIAKGEYLLFLNSGDWLFKNEVLEKTCELIQPDASVCSANIYFDDGNSLIHYTSPLSVDFNYLLNGSLSHPSSFIKRSMFEKHGMYNEANKIASDWEFFFLILVMKGGKYQKLQSTLTVFNITGISNEPSMKAVIDKEREEAINRFLPKLLHSELVNLQKEMLQYKILKQRVSGRRYLLLEQIEKNVLLSRLLTIQMFVLSKIVNFLAKL